MVGKNTLQHQRPFAVTELLDGSIPILLRGA